MDDTKAESRLHRHKLLDLLGQRGLDFALICGNGEESAMLRYFCSCCPLYGDAYYFMFRDGREKLFIHFDWEIEEMALKSGIADISAPRDIGEALEREITSLKGRVGTIGVPDVSFPQAMLATQLLDGRMENLTERANAMRRVKTPAEIELLEKAAQITEQAILDTLRYAPGADSAADIGAYHEYRIKRTGSKTAFPTLSLSGRDTMLWVADATSAPFAPGETLILDSGARWHGYCADVTRTFVKGKPTREQSGLHAVLCEILEDLTKFVRPGIPASSVHEESLRLYALHGLEPRDTRIGHGIGLETSAEPLDLRADSFPLEKGMTFCIEPGYYRSENIGGMRVEDDFVVTENGCRVIGGGLRRELFVVG